MTSRQRKSLRRFFLLGFRLAVTGRNISRLCANISGADHRFCAAGFCSACLGGRGLAFACFALPRRHCSTTSTVLGGEPEYVDDQFFGSFLSLLHLPAFLLGRIGLSICRDWYGRWRHSRLAWSNGHSLGKPIRRTFLHSEPLAGVSHRIRDRRTCSLRLVARYAPRHQRYRRSTFVNHSLRRAAFPGSRCRIDRLLSGVLRWSASAHRPTRATAT